MYLIKIVLFFPRYIHYVRFAVCDDMVFLSATLWEEMGKAVCYKVMLI